MALEGMAAAPRPLDRFATLVMCGLCASWGLNQVAAKIALVDIAPVTQSALRSGLGSIVLLGYAWRARPAIFRRDGAFWPGLVIGLLFAAEFIALFLSLQWTTASSAVLFLFTSPFFVGLGALVALPNERLRPLQWLGMALAFLGVAIGLAKSSAGATLFGDLLALLAGAFWGATTVVLKATRLRAIDPVKVLLYQTITGTLASALLALAIGEPWPVHVGLAPALSLAYQSIYIVAFTYVVWFWLLGTYRAAELSAFTFASPIVGVLAGWLILGDELTPTFLASVALVAAGILTINWPARRA
jgi:drug/metabolite transporter (DMT)-like permease